MCLAGIGGGGRGLAWYWARVGVEDPVHVVADETFRLRLEDANERLGRGFRTPWATRVAKKSSERAGPPTRGDNGKKGIGQEEEAMW